MLILSLKENEKVIIGKEIRVMVVNIKGKQIRIGIQAPAGIEVLREDLTLRENIEIVEQKENAFPKSMFQILEEEDPALLYFIKKKK
jgi:carbon storage regulator